MSANPPHTPKDVYTGDGETFIFPITFDYDRAADVFVFLTNSDGTTKTMVQNQDYVVRTDNSTVVTRVDDNRDPIATGVVITIQLQMQFVQPSGRAAMSAKVFRNRVDSLTRMFQQLREQLNRTLHIGEQYTSYALLSDEYVPVLPGFVAAMNANAAGAMLLSLDGLTFVEKATGAGGSGFGIGFSQAQNRLIISSSNASATQLARSDDLGETWAIYAGPFPSHGGAITWCPNAARWLCAQRTAQDDATASIAWSADGITWTPAVTPNNPALSWLRILECGSRIIVSGQGNATLSIVYSDDGGETWTVAPNVPGNFVANRIAFDGSLYVIGDSSFTGRVMAGTTSFDEYTSLGPLAISQFAFKPDFGWLSGDTSGDLLFSSAPTVAWSAYGDNQAGCNDLYYAPETGRFYIGKSSGANISRIISSVDGLGTWDSGAPDIVGNWTRFCSGYIV